MKRILKFVMSFFLPSGDEMIKKILFSLKYRTEKVKFVIDNYYTVKEIYPQIYGDLDPTTETFRKNVEAA